MRDCERLLQSKCSFSRGTSRQAFMVYRKNKVMDDGIKHFVFIISSNTSIARYEKRCCVAMKQSLGTSRQKPLGKNLSLRESQSKCLESYFHSVIPTTTIEHTREELVPQGHCTIEFGCWKQICRYCQSKKEAGEEVLVNV
ncbi:hypothetical protein J6590_094276 [Homalodisca vitripennis]|nr:hypothetical protein J6590_094276 [Homalodisca vitripennis]